MAQYIDLDKLLKGLEDELKDKNPNDIAYLVFKLFIGRLNHEPTADVVPKSEVDLYKRQVDELEDELAVAYDKLENAKAEVEKIFEEIESIFNKKKYVPYSLDVIAKLKKEYTEGKE